MIEKGKISSFQMAIIMNPAIIATGILLVPSLTAAKAERDMWISPFWGSILGFYIVFVTYQLHKQYPKKTIIEYSERIIGKIPGKFISVLILLFYLHVTGIIIREYGEFISGNFLYKTPGIVIMLSMVLVCAFSVGGGIEVIARTAQIFVPIVVLLWLILVIFLLGDLNPNNMLPIFEKGVFPSILGSATSSAWFSEYLLIAFILPYLSDPEKGMRWGNYSVVSVLVILVITNITTLLLFGEITSDLLYPVMNAGRYISIAEFFEHLESIIMAIWIAGAFLKISIFYYALVLGVAQILRLSDYKPIVYPLGFLLVLVAQWSAPNLFELKEFLGTTSVFYFLFIQLVIPTFLLVIALLRKKLQAKRGMESEDSSTG
jgi:spore germination protein KB